MIKTYHRAEGLTGLYSLGVCENLHFKMQFLEITEVVGHSGIITYSYRTFGTASFVQKAEGRLTHSPCKQKYINLIAEDKTCLFPLCRVLKFSRI